MPEIKRTFSGSKMNKDMDERLVPPTEYRDALNVEVNTSEGSNVSTVQTILGNTALTSIFPAGSTCVGSIADTKTDKIYWLVAGASSTANNVTIYKDYILEYDVQNASYKYVLVDIYKVEIKAEGASTTANGFLYSPEISSVDSYNNIGIRLGMVVTGDNATTVDNYIVTDIQTDTNKWKILTSTGFDTDDDEDITFTSDRILNFDSSRLITGINILDGMLFWTDNYSEPKKINIERSIAGTGGTQYLQGGSVAGYASTVLSPPQQTFTGDTDTFHTRLVSSLDGVNLEVMTDRLKQKAVWLEEEHITVLRKAPLTPPYLEMSSTEANRTDSSGNANNISTNLTNFAFADTNGVLLSTSGVTYDATGATANALDTLTFDTVVDFRVGDVIILTNDPDEDISTFTKAQVRIRIEAIPAGGPSTGPYSWSVLAIDSTLGTSQFVWSARLEQSKALFEFKFPRFAYRYKYKDGEYSVISPWSEIAFLPINYNYAPKQGYNLGMVNQLRGLKITDYIVEDAARGRDVIEVDILFKNEDSPNIYTVKTIKPTDMYDPAGVYTGNWPDLAIYAYDRGEYEIESELIHAILPSSQLLRPWDNVPIKAKAQDITANRLIYGNYVQNYDVLDILSGEQITPDIQVSLESTLGDLANNVANAEPVPSKSVKSLRTYQVGVVYRDKYGRETPVLAGNAVDSTIKVKKQECLSFNKIKAKISSPPPYWADSWKFFIKETSNEYYSLAMDRWYNAEDGNVWISFPSAERNKIQDDTFLILKKQHTTDVAVTTEARYKVIAIENEAPEFITRNTKVVGKLDGGTSVSSSTAGFPYIDYNSFKVNAGDFFDEFTQGDSGAAGMGIDAELRNAMHSGFLFARFSIGSTLSKYYKIANMVEESGGMVEISIDGKFGEDMRFVNPTQVTGGIVSGIDVELATKIPEKKAEFDGKFFVKILKDLNLRTNILSYSGTGDDDWTVVDAMSGYYVAYDTITTSTAGVEMIASNGTSPATSVTYFALPKGATSTAEVRAANNNNIQGGSGVKESVAQWWQQWGAGWFIDAAMTANEDADGIGSLSSGSGNEDMGGSGALQFGGSNIAKYQDISDSTVGVFNASISGMDTGGVAFTPGPGTGLALSWSGIYPIGTTVGTDDTYYDNHSGGFINQDWGVGDSVHASQFDIVDKLGIGNGTGVQFRFADDPDSNVYTILYTSVLENRFNYDADDGGGTGSFNHAANKRKTWKLVVQDADGFGIGNAGGNGMSYNPTDFTNDNGNWGSIASSSNPVRIEFVEAFSEDDTQIASNNPAVWETEPKENVGLDIYYEATQAYPIDINARTNEQFAKYGSIALNDTAVGTALAWTGTIKVQSWSGTTVTLDTVIPQDVAIDDIISFTAPDGGVTRLAVKTAIDMLLTPTAQGIEFKNTPHEQLITLPYSNCYSFQNGVESNRIRDDYNEIYIKNGVKASAVLAEHYEQERRGAGLIHSGIYNSTSGTNDLNQFIQANPITKDLNPRHGSIQVLANRDTDLVAITEDKCFKIPADKDMLFNADGSAQLIASNKVLGTATAYAGDFGTTNPESFASDLFRSYFVDRTRGKVCRLSMDGVTPISSAGMHDWFADNLQVSTSTIKTTIDTVIGSFDAKKQLYNVTINQKNSPIKGRSYESPVDTFYTLSYSETAGGWVSFKSFHPESGLSINNDYYTFDDGELWKHHTNATRNNFYGVQYDSSVTTILNDDPGSIKSFNTLNYEGSQAKITQHKLTSNTTDANGASVSQADGEYYNLNTKTGWYVDTFETNEQSATIPEFKEKEGKWFNYIRGVTTTHVNDSESLAITSSNLDQQEFSVQGIGVPSAVAQSGMANNVYKFKVTNNTSTTYNPDTERDGNTDGVADGIWDVPPGD